MHRKQAGTGPEPAQAVREAAYRLGFVRVGFARAERFDEAAVALVAWLGRGYQGDMHYLSSGLDRAEPRSLQPTARTIVSVALPYASRRELVALKRHAGGPEAGTRLQGAVASYAIGADYHRVLKTKLEALAVECRRILGSAVSTRSCVDTAPLLEHEAARRAGIGFTGKSTLTIAPGQGTTVLLGELLLDATLPADEPIASGCGTCTQCLDACPTGAFAGPYVLDARRCISYLTIEHRGPIPEELRRPIGKRVFGCDVCQDVCPFNASKRAVPAAPELTDRPSLATLDLVALLELTSSGYRRLVRSTALRRVSRAQLARNAAIALGNSGDERAVQPLSRALSSHRSALVRLHAAWALGEIGGNAALAALRTATDDDRDRTVRAEARAAIARMETAER